MKTQIVAIAFGAVAIASTANAQMPTWSEDQTSAWAYVVQSWEDDVANNGKWPADYVADQAVSWGDENLVPRGKDDWISWSKYGDANSTTEQYSLQPMAIAVHGDTAVVNYLAQVATVDSEGERETSTTGIVETIVRTDGEWTYLSSAGFSFLDD